MDAREMPKYQCHKQVWALQISNIDVREGHILLEVVEEGYEPISVNPQWYNKHKPEVGGYFVMYKGGYTSYSPKEVFEEGYTIIEVPSPWSKLKETICRMENMQEGTGWHINQDAARCALDHVNFLEMIGATPPKVFALEDSALVFSWEDGKVKHYLTADEDGVGSVQKIVFGDRKQLG